MNIKEAKEEIIRTVRAYQRKDETGAYEIPFEQQRPILLIGPPGIGKTAIMEQIAETCGIGLVSYTITHHTRQSAIGLPMISHHNFDGKDCAVTEYTMSEIVASVYEKIEKTGIREGILFLDEINCVSETLAPTMLQFLQYKTFGTHRVPEGWLIVTAGNQPQYNRAARDFDIVTLDRVKKMEIEADFAVWKEYANRIGLHGAILSYLGIKPQHFYVIRTELDGRHFVTARGWEDLSRMIFTYEGMGEDITETMVVQYLQDAEIARDFAVYYDLYRKYSESYRIADILNGNYHPEPETFRYLPFDEKLSLIRLLADSLHQEFMKCTEEQKVQEILFDQLLTNRISMEENDALKTLTDAGEYMRRDLKNRMDADMISRESVRNTQLALKSWDELTSLVAGQREANSFDLAKGWFNRREDGRQDRNAETAQHLTNVFSFINEVYGSSQEMVMFLTELNADWHCLEFIRNVGCEAYDKYNGLLLLHDRKESLRQEIMRLVL